MDHVSAPDLWRFTKFRRLITKANYPGCRATAHAPRYTPYVGSTSSMASVEAINTTTPEDYEVINLGDRRAQ
jgi:hypothetical protein